MRARRQLLRLSLPLLLLVLAGCTTLSDTMVKERGTGEKVVYQASFEEIWQVMPAVIESTGLRFVSANRNNHLFLARHPECLAVGPYGAPIPLCGENVAIFVEKNKEIESNVEVISKKATPINIFSENWKKLIFEQLDKRFNRT